jgi:hypothetical protein
MDSNALRIFAMLLCLAVMPQRNSLFRLPLDFSRNSINCPT